MCIIIYHIWCVFFNTTYALHYLTKKITSKNHLVRNQNLPRQEQVSLDLQVVVIVLAVAFVEELVVVAAASAVELVVAAAAAAFVEEHAVVALIVD